MLLLLGNLHSPGTVRVTPWGGSFRSVPFLQVLSEVYQVLSNETTRATARAYCLMSLGIPCPTSLEWFLMHGIRVFVIVHGSSRKHYCPKWQLSLSVGAHTSIWWLNEDGSHRLMDLNV